MSLYLELWVVLDLDAVVIPGDGGLRVGDDGAVEDEGGAVGSLSDCRLGRKGGRNTVHLGQGRRVDRYKQSNIMYTYYYVLLQKSN